MRPPIALLLPALLVACLPKDTRPPPARVLFTATPSAATKAGGFTTADGWSITFHRVLVSLGRVSLDGDRCSVYSDADYRRILSLIDAPDAQKISESYAIGACDFSFSIGNAGSDSLLGFDATADDLAFLRTAGRDRYGGPSGISVFAAGGAEKGDERLTFAWPFRGRARFRECQRSLNGVNHGLVLGEDEDVSLDVTLHAEALFADDVKDPNAALRFDAIASADAFGDGDGEVTLEELSKLPLADVQTDTAYANSDPDAEVSASVIPWLSLEDFIYLGAVPSIARYDETGHCRVELAPPPR